MAYRLALVGATGNVGRAILACLEERSFPLTRLHLLASERSVGKSLSYGDKEVLTVENIENFDFNTVDLVFFCAGEREAHLYIPRILKTSRAFIIDKSSAYRMEPHVPLVVPEVNAPTLSLAKDKRLIASPNCVVIPVALCLKALAGLSAPKQVVLSTYQSVSGAGREAMDELYLQTKATYVNEVIPSQYFPKTIAFNVIPHIDGFESDGFTGEEHKIISELKKIISPSLQVTPTCVRVPVFVGHAAAVHATFEGNISVPQARASLKEFSGIRLMDDPKKDLYATPLDVVGEDAVYISRLRQDPRTPNELTFWVACDNLRKGAALNAVQIAESLHTQGFLRSA
jgi:aspartate-semialdehyde dehydrogenase